MHNNDRLLKIIEKETRLLHNTDGGIGSSLPAVADVQALMQAIWDTIFFEGSCHHHCTGAEITQGLLTVYTRLHHLLDRAAPEKDTGISTTETAMNFIERMHPIRELLITDIRARTVVPAELLRRRPDIIEAERTLAEQAAALGVSKKEFLPRLSIEGSVGFAAHDADELFKGHSMTYSVAPTLSWTLFDGFGRRAAVATAREQMNIASTQYEQTVLAAVTDVENALATYINATQLVDDLREVVNSAATFMGDAVEQYRSGLTNFTPVADAQISFLQYANNLIQARAQRLTSIIELYKAQGGGVDIE